MTTIRADGSIPQARIVRNAGQLVAPPRLPRRPWQLRTQLRTAAQVAVGMWPLVAMMLLMTMLLYFAGTANAP